MGFNSVQECACRAMNNLEHGRPLVIISRPQDTLQISSIVGVSVGLEADCYGAVWHTKDGDIISVHRYEDEPHEYPGGFDLTICNGGEPPTAEDRRNIQKWRDAAG